MEAIGRTVFIVPIFIPFTPSQEVADETNEKYSVMENAYLAKFIER
jgi:hypothetical protein